jgi:aspartyl-tRNA(Asn)/glutamyl-tRNA(Gln) amidotransferase subunit B
VRPSVYIQKCKAFGFHKEYINALLLDKPLFDFFFASVEKGFAPKTVAKRLVGEQQSSLAEFPSNFPQLFEAFLTIEQEKKLIDNQLKIVFDELLQTGKLPADIVKEKGFDTPPVETAELANLVQEIIAAHPAVVEQYKGGKETAIGFFVGQVMRKT